MPRAKVVHKLIKDHMHTAECGFSGAYSGRRTWNGITCKRCLRVKEVRKSKKQKK